MNRLQRTFATLLISLAVPSPLATIAAQETAPDASSSLLDRWGLPTIDVIATNDGIMAHARADTELVPYAVHPETGTVLYTEPSLDSDLVQWGTHPETGAALYTAAPARVAAGSVLIVGHNETDGVITIAFSQLPDEITVDDVLAEDRTPTLAADPVITAGLELAPRQTGRIVALLDAGDYTVIAAGEVAIASPATSLLVTGGVPDGTAEVIATSLT